MTHYQRPRLLDLFCCQGGASHGYHLAGFDVTGVDIDPQPRYPYPFIEADALAYLIEYGHEYDVIVGSPPCQRHTLAQRIQGNRHPDFISPMRQLVRALGKPYVIENVAGAPLISPVELCGCMFLNADLHTFRPRLFESNLPLVQPSHRQHTGLLGIVGRESPDPRWEIVNRLALAKHLADDPDNVEYVDEIASEPQVIAYLHDHAPHLLVQIERVRADAFTAALRAAREGGDPAPGIARVKPEGRLYVRPDKAADAAVERLVQAGVITWDGRPLQLPAGTSPAPSQPVPNEQEEASA